MNRFLKEEDELARNINEQSNLLFSKLKNLEVDGLGLPYHCLHYFKGSHFKRLFFSIETSAHLLYRAISIAGKSVEEIVIMDYGAGVGTLYSLAKMIGCKMVLYNDHLEEWKTSAQLIGRAIGVEADQYIVGDIDETLDYLLTNQISCTIIASRNVIEHIYRLDYFFTRIAEMQPNAIVYSSTTANNKNPGTRIQHYLLHKKFEKKYFPKRLEIIRRNFPHLSGIEAVELAKRSIGKAGKDIDKMVSVYLNTGSYPAKDNYRTNTCDPETGVWAEHLLLFAEYRKLIGPRFTIEFKQGFWDTHYRFFGINGITRLFNLLIHRLAGIGFFLSPFIYVIAIPKKQNS
jgi:2-polyprenyl-3-methyl-5-hydroxy-6-metoxy-1,4-benzoquinol methylase